MAGQVRIEREGEIGWVLIDHPERRNALSSHMWSQLAAAADELDADDGVRVVVLRGAGEAAFISGADISEFDPLHESASPGDTSKNLRAGGGDAFASLSGLRKPLLAMIHGPCIGGGLAVALCADLRYASRDARFGIPAARLGVGYDIGGVDALARVVGLPNAKEILFTGRRYDAAEAKDMGLVNRVIPAPELEAEVRELAEQISRNAPLTVRSVKLIAQQLEKPTAERDSELVRNAVRACFESEDFAEGVRAFMAKRKPRFEGR
jgi:enoyl-CoA hydratase/carnithine racemase